MFKKIVLILYIYVESVENGGEKIGERVDFFSSRGAARNPSKSFPRKIFPVIF